MKRFAAMMHARNMEFLRDKGTLFWNLIFPFFLVFGFAFLFSGRDESLFKIGVTGNPGDNAALMEEYHAEIITYADPRTALDKLRHHEIDMVMDYNQQVYFINEESAKGDVVEALLLGNTKMDLQRRAVTGNPIRYVDWFVPGVIGMNMMFSCIFGVGWVIVRYRKNGVLKRLKATPVLPVEFVLSQLVSRFIIVLITAVIVYAGSNFFLGFMMKGSYINLILVTAIATVCMIAFGLIFASRIRSEELAGGLMNLAIWPMMAFSGVFISVEGSPLFLQRLARIFPLTHYIEASRAIMLDGAGLPDIATNILVLVVMTAVFLLINSAIFRWE